MGQEWLKFVRSLPNKVEVSRSLARFREPVEGVVLHAFGDTSGSGISSAVYAVITQASGVSKGLIAAKSRLAKKNLTISTGLDKNLNSNLPFGEASLKTCLPEPISHLPASKK